MYQSHFGLAGDAFDNGIAQESAVYVGPREELITANFKVALTTLDSVVVLTGSAGVGKTTLATAALRATTTRLALGWLSGAPVSAHELLELLLVEFGFNPHRAGRIERQQMWRQFVSEMNATDSRVFVVAEQAEALGIETLRTLAALTAADPSGCRGANLVLLGGPELTNLLKTPALDALRQRVRLRQQLLPFDEETLGHYLRHRVTSAGGDFAKLFTADAIGELHLYSGGIARIANNLCETALTLAATQREPRISAQLVRRVATALFGLEPLESIAAAEGCEAAEAVETAVDDLPILTDAVEAAPIAASGGGLRVAPFDAASASAPLPVAEATPAALPVAEATPPAAEAIAAVSSLEDVSDTMAETLFGDADLDMLSAALASAGWDDEPLRKAPEEEEEEINLLDFGGRLELSLASDAPAPPAARRAAAGR